MAKRKTKVSGRPSSCPVCGAAVGIYDTGVIIGHNDPRRNGVVWCTGSGAKLDTPKKDESRPDDRSSPSSVRTVSGGLPALGKRQ